MAGSNYTILSYLYGRGQLILKTYFLKFSLSFVFQGAFPFSTRECGWIVADCTAEGLKAVLGLQKKCPFIKSHMTTEMIYESVDRVSIKKKLFIFGSISFRINDILLE